MRSGRAGWRCSPAIGLAVFALVGASGYYLSRPANELLYSGLDKQDVSRIGAALKDAGLSFDVSADGATVYVAYGDTAQARMLLAEQGLPRSGGTGYELFDKLGSLGLTSFMQEITRVRALEGELARTIQTMRGVKAARVHLVMPDEGSFRRAKQPPSASVVLRTEGADNALIAQAVRHLVAAALPAHDGRSGHRAQCRRAIARLRRGWRRLPGRARCWRSKKASPTTSRTISAARSRLISQPAQFPDQRRGAAQYRQEGNHADDSTTRTSRVERSVRTVKETQNFAELDDAVADLGRAQRAAAAQSPPRATASRRTRKARRRKS